jgi:heat-inducible transcriptional repressor
MSIHKIPLNLLGKTLDFGRFSLKLPSMIRELNDRTRQILKLVVDAYVETGEPVGSRAISQKLGMSLSPATIRSVMAELEERGLLYAPHTSAGRLPTENGMTVFVEGLLELDHLSAPERRRIEEKISAARRQSVTGALEEAGQFLSGLAACAGLVFAPTSEDAVRQIDFVPLSPGRALAVLVMRSGSVENRLLDVGHDVTASALSRAANYLNAHIADKTLAQASEHIRRALGEDRAQLDALTARVVAAGIASIAPAEAGGHLFIKGQANLLNDVTAIADLERIRSLFEALETKETMLNLLQATAQGEGVKIYIGAENKLFSHAGCSLIVAPYKSQDARVMGAIGVIGPMRLNYSRVIPVINYTSELIGRIL